MAKKKSRGLAARAVALEKAVVKMFTEKKPKAKKRKKAAPAKAAKKKKTAKKIKTIKRPKPKARKNVKPAKKTRRKSRPAAPVIEQLVPGGEPLFVTPMDKV